MTRTPVVAGQFYPDSPHALREQVRGYLAGANEHANADATENSTNNSTKNSFGYSHDKARTLLAMVPHAGYIYSGAVCGKTIASANLPDTLLMLGPNHTGRGAGVSVWSGGGWQTPLGVASIDEGLAQCLVTHDPVFTPDKEAHLREHSLEVVVPFLQEKVENLAIVPIAFSDPSPDTLARAGAAIARCIREYGKDIGIVVSSDMSHYISQQDAKRLDGYALEKIRKVDPEGLYNVVRDYRISMCGVLPMTAALVACSLLGVQEARVVEYATSGDVSGDTEQVVGYAGVVADW